MIEKTKADWLLEFPPPRSLPLDQEALRVFEGAYHIGVNVEPDGDPVITFSTLLLGLLTAEDETSKWFQRLASANGPDISAVREEKKLSESALTSVTPVPGPPVQPRLSRDKQLLTSSARAVLETAEEWAERVGGSDIGVRHLVAAYVLNPPAAHRSQMNEWKFEERAWRPAFFEWIAPRYTAESWGDVRDRHAPTKAVAAFEQTKVKGEALAFPADGHAQQVLARATEYQARRDDTWLRLQTVFFALVDVAAEDDSVRAAVAPIANAVAPIAARYHAARDSFLKSEQDKKPLVSFDALDISPRVLNALETARDLARAAGGAGGQVGVLPLAGALISRRVDSDEELGLLGLEPRALRLALIHHATPTGAYSEVWREALGEEDAGATGRPVDLNSDEPEAVVRTDESWTNDPLAIRPDVESFAALLASKSLEPPLSIGLFGPWGSGKTTFLKRLRRAIDVRAAQAKADQVAAVPTPYIANVVHVEFNAWHFTEDALISSLLDTILAELKAFIKDDYPDVGKALAELKSETAERSRRKVQEAKEAEATARGAVETAAKNVSAREADARAETTSFRAVVQAAWKETRAALAASPVVQQSRVLEHVGDTVEGVDDLRAQLNATRNRPARLLSDLGWPRALLLAALVLALPPALAWLVGRVTSIGPVGETLTGLTGLLSVAGVALRTMAGGVARIDQAIAEVTANYEERLRTDPGVIAAELKLEGATAAVRGATEALASAQRSLQSAEADAAAATLPAQMAELAGRRVDERTYARELTTISTARGDLRMLSQLLREQRAATTGAQADARPVDRVILYVDDLDRCQPEDVVRVLQVVHMLLAFELFVVVVAVDARWVEESLVHNYTWLAGASAGAGDGAGVSGGVAGDPSGRPLVTTQDYLEKIFQISFWLAPLTSAHAADYLKSLVRTAPRQDGPVIGSQPAQGAAGAALGSGGAGKVEIAAIELDYMRALSAYVGPSPRRVKRLVNAYRLLKARMSDKQLESFLADRSTDERGVRSGPYQLVIGLLVIGTGAPASAAQILAELAERDPRHTLDAVIESFRQRQHPDWTVAAQVLETLMRTQKANDVSELRGWARSVGRFLLQGPAGIAHAGRGEAIAEIQTT